MTKLFYASLLVTFLLFGITNTQREKILFDYNWEFRLNEETTWKNIDIPHDFSMIQKFSEEYECESGFLPGGKGYYRKKFTLPKFEDNKSIIVYFYGAYKDTYVSINGEKVGENHYGYSSFSFDISKNVIADNKTENLLEVFVDNQLYSSRWYPGSGISRSVYLIITEQVHIAVDGLKIETPNIKDGKGTVKVQTEVINDSESTANVILKLEIKDKEGKTVVEYMSSGEEVEKNNMKLFEAELNVENPKLWSDKDPYLYTLEVELLVGEKCVDNYSNKFGFRYYSFDKNGFTFNGVPTKLNGVCLHVDYGALGNIDNYDAGYKRFIKLKDMGVNAIRTSHNTAHKTWIEMADELGFYVIEEFFDGWEDMKNGNSNDVSKYFNTPIEDKNTIIGGKNGMTWAEYVVKSTVKRDRNNPSIILWSIGNEVDGLHDNYPNIAKNIIIWVKTLDETRPFTYADYRLDNAVVNGIYDEVVKNGGICGLNYANHFALRDWANKKGAIYLSESASALNSRGIYSVIENGKNDNLHLTSYDTSHAGWSNNANYYIWAYLSNDCIAGEFVWTGYDYIGEPVPWQKSSPGSVSGAGAVPNVAYFGIIDTAGFPKDTYYLYRSQLNKDSFTLHLVTAWDKNNIILMGGNKSPVFVYTNVPKAEIYRDDISTPLCSLSREIVKTEQGHERFIYKVESIDNKCEAVKPDGSTELFGNFNIEFKEGTKLYTKAYDEDGKEISKEKIIGNQLIGQPNLDKLKLSVKTDKNKIKADVKSLVFVEVSIVDDNEILNTKGENLVTFTLEGEGKILGVDNGDQATVKKFQQENVLIDNNYALINAYAGKALAIISGTKNEGKIQLTIGSEGLEDVTISIESEQ